MFPLQDVFPDKATERKILSLAIKCPSDGCDWTGELRNKEVWLTDLLVFINCLILLVGVLSFEDSIIVIVCYTVVFNSKFYCWFLCRMFRIFSIY